MSTSTNKQENSQKEEEGATESATDGDTNNTTTTTDDSISVPVELQALRDAALKNKIKNDDKSKLAESAQDPQQWQQNVVPTALGGRPGCESTLNVDDKAQQKSLLQSQLLALQQLPKGGAPSGVIKTSSGKTAGSSDPGYDLVVMEKVTVPLAASVEPFTGNEAIAQNVSNTVDNDHMGDEEQGEAMQVHAELAPDYDDIRTERDRLAEERNQLAERLEQLQNQQDLVVKAEPIHRSKWTRICAVLWFLKIVAAIVLVVFFTSQRPSSSSSSTESTLTNGTTATTTSPSIPPTINYDLTTSRFLALKQTFYQHGYDNDTYDFTNVSHPVTQALHWMANQDPAKLAVVSYFDDNSAAQDEWWFQLHQRFVLVVLYFATDGPKWLLSVNWLETFGVCRWDKVNCDGEHITYLEMNNNQMEGTLPSEIGLLTALTNVELGGNRGLTSTVPTDIGRMTNLESLNLAEMHLTGPLPSEMGMMSHLRFLATTNTGFSGAIPSEFGNWVNVTDIYISKNFHSGTLPLELGNLSNLARFHFLDNNFTGTFNQMCNGTAFRFEAMEDFLGDCIGPDPEVQCPCCNVCCGPTTCCETDNEGNEVCNPRT